MTLPKKHSRRKSQQETMTAYLLHERVVLVRAPMGTRAVFLMREMQIFSDTSAVDL